MCTLLTFGQLKTQRPLAIEMNGMKAIVLEKKKRIYEWDLKEHSSYPEMAQFFSFILELSRKPKATLQSHRAKRAPRQPSRLPSRLRQSTSTADMNHQNEIHQPDEK